LIFEQKEELFGYKYNASLIEKTAKYNALKKLFEI